MALAHVLTVRLVVMALASLFAAGNAVADDFACRVRSVTDGDTFRCDDGTRVRLHGIDAPEMDTAQGPASRDALRLLIEGRAVACAQKGTSYNRVVATCLLDGEDIAAMMVERVMARDCPRYSGGAYSGLETDVSSELPLGKFCEL